MIIKKIFNKEFDEEVHSDFLKFGKGEFQDKYLIEAKKQKDNWTIKTGPEFANHFVKMLLKDVSGLIPMKGVIVTTLKLESEIGFPIKKVGNFQGIRKIEIDTEVSPKEILGLMEKYPRVFFALSFSVNGNDLKIKPKAPKSAKPSAGDKEAKAEFCSLKTSSSEIIKEIFFDFPDFKEISIRHTIKVNEMIYPSNVESLKPEEIRLQSKRKGVVVRKIMIDGREEVKEAEFVA
jgi:hypothetical protein